MQDADQSNQMAKNTFSVADGENARARRLLWGSFPPCDWTQRRFRGNCAALLLLLSLHETASCSCSAPLQRGLRCTLQRGPAQAAPALDDARFAELNVCSLCMQVCAYDSRRADF